MPKINQEEYEILKKIDDKWKWIARDKFASQFPDIYQTEPLKGNEIWFARHAGDYETIENGKLFQFVQWEDDKPYNIAELIEEYESEEKEVKTLESIREEIWEEMLRLEDKRKDQWADIKYQTLREVLQKLGHLDEPEVLWQELPVIPKFVADWYESEGKRTSWWNWFYKWGRDEHRTDLETKTIRWMQDFNEELFVDIFRYGYEVEEEQKYYVLDTEYIPMLVKSYGAVNRANTHLSIHEKGRNTEHYQLTEQEIKDYDIRYWPFAKPVEGVEE